MHKYHNYVSEMAKIGMLIAVTWLISFMTSTYGLIPIVPFFNARPDIWFGIAFVCLFFINWKYRGLFILALPFVLMPTEISSYLGFADYAYEFITPFVIGALLTIIPIKKPLLEILWFFVSFIIYFFLRTVVITHAGVIFYEVPWKGSFIYNFPNIAVDFLFSLPIFLVLAFKLKKRIKY